MARRFSERHGYKVSKILNYNEMPQELKNRIWNLLKQRMMPRLLRDVSDKSRNLYIMYDEFFKKDADELWGNCEDMLDSRIKPKFFVLDWNEVYDFVEYHFEVYVDSNLQESINKLFIDEKVPYRMIEGLVTPITNEQEIKSIEEALNPPEKYKFVSDQFEKALIHYSDRTMPDYENSIKESINAVETLVKIQLNDKDGTLGRLVKNMGLHEDLQDGIKKLYHWASDDDGGIRHGKKADTGSYEAEAKYALVVCSALANFLIQKENL